MSIINHTDNVQTLSKIAGRDCNSYCANLNTKQKSQILNDLKQRERYRATNLTKKTLEVRVFASTTNIDELLGRVEFIFALVEWTKAKGKKQYLLTSFCEKVKTSQKYKKYTNLIAYLTKIGL